MNRPDAYLEVPHNDDAGFHDWVWLPGWRGDPVTVTRAVDGRKRQHGWTTFAVMMCNNTECGGRAILRAEVMRAATEAALPTGYVA